MEKRPSEVETHEKFGHWEIDTVNGSSDSSAVLLTLDERMTRKRHIVKITVRTTKALAEGLKQIREQYGEGWSTVFCTITGNDGSRAFAALPKLFEKMKIDVLFTSIQCMEAWHKRITECSYLKLFPKGRGFAHVSDQTVLLVENWVNNIPQKSFIVIFLMNFFNLSYLIVQIWNQKN